MKYEDGPAIDVGVLIHAPIERVRRLVRATVEGIKQVAEAQR